MKKMELNSESRPSDGILSVLLFDNGQLNEGKLDSVLVNCVKCERPFTFPENKDDYLAHLFLEHRLVIADVEDIPYLEDYLKYWCKQFQKYDLEEYCTTMLLDQLPDGTPSKSQKYYLLSDIVTEDCELRRKLKDRLLANVLSQHQYELTDRTFTKECLYCRLIVTGLRANYLEHLYSKHFLQLGKPENLVFIDELLTKVKYNMDNLICLYCEKIFKDRQTLKEHMRKKAHKRINPNLRIYDKYFLENYQFNDKSNKCRGKSKQKRPVPNKVKLGNSQETLSVDFEKHFAVHSDNSDPEWEDWSDEVSQPLMCLFCIENCHILTHFKQHLLEQHDVNFEKCLENLNIYQRIKIVNYVRRQVCLHRCVTCNKRFNSSETLLQHFQLEKHYGMGEQNQWDKPEYFFPTYEDDALLCLLDDKLNDDDNVDDTAVNIISEDFTAQINKEAENLSLENFSLS